MIVNLMMENFTTSSKGSETSKNNEKYSLELNLNSDEYSFRNERIHVWLFRTNIRYIRSSPKYLPDLNPLDFSMWSILEERVNCKKYPSLADLRQALLREWEKIPQEHVWSSVESFIDRLRR